MGFTSVLFALSIISILTTKSTVEAFNCSSTGTCNALIDYVSPNTTNITAIRNLFGVRNHRTILGANNYPLSTLPNFTVNAQQKIKIPFPCECTNGTGYSNRRPVYTVQAGDVLDHIAVDVFSRLVTYPQIQAVNNIPNPNLIEIGQRLWIPLPCSCDEVGGAEVVHYGHVVESGSTVEQIAQEYGTTEATLLMLNGLPSPNALQANSVLDVPLKACTTNIRNDSLDSPLLVSNGTYIFTANNCIMCRCDAANNWTLQCEPSQLRPSSNWTTCPSMQCEGTGLYIGNTTSSTACNQTTCAYAGYNNQTIFTTLATVFTCSAAGSFAPKISLDGLSWSFLLICLHLAVLCFHPFQ